VTDSHPTLTEQIDAVEWATQQARDLGRRRTKLKPNEIYSLVCRLEAAVETLMTLEFGRATLK
jgi:hypothetical protein